MPSSSALSRVLPRGRLVGRGRGLGPSLGRLVGLGRLGRQENESSFHVVLESIVGPRLAKCASYRVSTSIIDQSKRWTASITH